VPGNPSNSPTVEDEHWELIAVVGPGSTNNAKYAFDLSGWSVEDHSLSMTFRRPFLVEFTDEEIYLAVADLEHILSSLFVNDHIPRKIFYFFYPGPGSRHKEVGLRLTFMLGQSGGASRPNPAVSREAFSQTGWIYNKKTDWPSDVVPSTASITKWIELFRNNESIAGCVGLLQNSFATINRMAGEYRHYEYMALASAFILMISGLESLFLKGSDHADVSFKFKMIGTAYYTKYVTSDFLTKFGPETKKLSSSEIMNLLGALYDIRSAIAHGRTRSLFSGKQAKQWKPVFEALRVQWKEPKDKNMFFSNLLLALGLLQKHILALIWCSGENLNKGADIVNDLFET